MVLDTDTRNGGLCTYDSCSGIIVVLFPSSFTSHALGWATHIANQPWFLKTSPFLLGSPDHPCNLVELQAQSVVCRRTEETQGRWPASNSPYTKVLERLPLVVGPPGKTWRRQHMINCHPPERLLMPPCPGKLPTQRFECPKCSGPKAGRWDFWFRKAPQHCVPASLIWHPYNYLYRMPVDLEDFV